MWIWYACACLCLFVHVWAHMWGSMCAYVCMQVKVRAWSQELLLFIHFILWSMVSQSNLELLIMTGSQFALWMELQVGFHAHLIFMGILGSQNLHTCLASALINEQPCHTQSFASYNDRYHIEYGFCLQVPSSHGALQSYKPWDTYFSPWLILFVIKCRQYVEHGWVRYGPCYQTFFIPIETWLEFVFQHALFL